MSSLSDDLRTGAERLFFAQNPNLIPAARREKYEARGAREQVIGEEAPVRDGLILRVSIRWPSPAVGRAPLVSLREFLISPWGERYATRYGMTMDAHVLPQVAMSLAATMEVLAEAEERQTEERRRGERR
jgi:hypothetical protein